ncbi:Splicing factor U2af large subunit A [Hordeum vulgare]|nr:Splicing factor U2af large subunit A [Hordeum vulgare]
MANNGDLSPPTDGGSQELIPVIYQSRYSMTPQGPPCSWLFYYRPVPLGGFRRRVYEDGTTKVVRLSQMFSPNELQDDEYYRKVCERMKGEGLRYGGKLVRTVVPRPDPSGAPVAGVGKVFLESADIDSAAYSKGMLHCMRFEGKQPVVVFYPEDKFADGDYDG